MNPDNDPFPIGMYYVRNSFSASKAKTSEAFDVHIPEIDHAAYTCREPNIGTLSKVSRFIGGDADKSGPFDIFVYLGETENAVLRVHRYSKFLSGPQIDLSAGSENAIGTLKREFWSISASYLFTGTDPNDRFRVKLASRLNGYSLKIGGLEAAKVLLGWSKENPINFKERFSHAIEILEGADTPAKRFTVFAIGLCINKMRH